MPTRRSPGRSAPGGYYRPSRAAAVRRAWPGSAARGCRDRRGLVHRLHVVPASLPHRCDPGHEQAHAHGDCPALHGLRAVFACVPGGLHSHAKRRWTGDGLGRLVNPAGRAGTLAPPGAARASAARATGDPGCVDACRHGGPGRVGGDWRSCRHSGWLGLGWRSAGCQARHDCSRTGARSGATSRRRRLIAPRASRRGDSPWCWPAGCALWHPETEGHRNPGTGCLRASRRTLCRPPAYGWHT